MKKTLLVMALIAALASLAAAGQGPHPTAAVTASSHVNAQSKLPSGTLYYGGDWDPNSSTWVALGNGNEYDAGTVYEYTNYSAFVVPTGQTWTVTAAFTNNLVYNYSTGSNSCKLDASTNTWTINSGTAKGTAGTVIASGSGPASCTYTGRQYSSVYYEYTVNVPWAPATVLTAGTYFLGIVPSCTESSCATFFYNTDSSKANRQGSPPPACLGVQNGPAGGVNFVNDCTWYVNDYGYTRSGVSQWSAGVVGTSSGD